MTYCMLVDIATYVTQDYEDSIGTTVAISLVTEDSIFVYSIANSFEQYG